MTLLRDIARCSQPPSLGDAQRWISVADAVLKISTFGVRAHERAVNDFGNSTVLIDGAAMKLDL